MATNFGNSSTAYSALAVSATCHTTTAAISIGLPSASFTLAIAVSWLRIRTDTFRRRVNGFTHCRPGARIVPWYRPNSCTTRASPATTDVRPCSASRAAISSRTATTSRSVWAVPAAWLMPRISSSIPATSSTTPAARTGTPGADHLLLSATGRGASPWPGLTGACTAICTTSG